MPLAVTTAIEERADLYEAVNTPFEVTVEASTRKIQAQ